MKTATQAISEARRWRRNRDDYCLYTVQRWFDAPWSGPWAEDAWNRWGGQHKGDRNPPAGVPVYFHSPRHKYGHIALSLGGGRLRSTDWPRDTYVGETTITSMERAWGIRYLGWSDRFSGGAIRGITSHAPTRPAHPGGHDMPISNDDAKKIASAVWAYETSTGWQNTGQYDGNRKHRKKVRDMIVESWAMAARGLRR